MRLNNKNIGKLKLMFGNNKGLEAEDLPASSLNLILIMGFTLALVVILVVAWLILNPAIQTLVGQIIAFFRKE